MPNGILSMVCPPGAGCPLTAIGLPHILLWVLTFAIVFGVLSKAKILGRAPAALISIAVGFLVLMAVPATLISVIAGMSTGLVAVAIGALALIALLEVAGTGGTTKEGQHVPFIKMHSTAAAAVMFIIAVAVFWAVGGFALLGIGIPAFSMGTWLLIIVGVAVLWMLSEAKGF
ncbi:MAG: hypothetical protein GTN40_04910 [Candidatus Aenigmarchaeota archaeon]|nr:hypothetical protein [Candidatus Aenigmarchaeota archaeon]